MRSLHRTRFLAVVVIALAWAARLGATDNIKLPWSASQATGEPNTHEARDMKTAWATLEQDQGGEWIKLEYETPVDVQMIRIHETFNPGAVCKVTAFTLDGTETSVWEGEQAIKEAPNAFEVHVTQDVKSQSIKIYLDTKRVAGWNEIDAVELIGLDGSRQWAVDASASSTYASRLAKMTPQTPTYESLPPSVVSTVPQAGDTTVDPSLGEIRVTFSKDMLTEKMWAFCQVSDDTFPKRPKGQEIRYLADKRTCVLPVELEANKTYVIWINSGRFNSFRDTQNNPSVPYLLVFKTKP